MKTIGIKASIKQKLTILIPASTSKPILCDSARAFRSADVWVFSLQGKEKKNVDQTHRRETPPKCIAFPYVK